MCSAGEAVETVHGYAGVYFFLRLNWLACMCLITDVFLLSATETQDEEEKYHQLPSLENVS